MKLLRWNNFSALPYLLLFPHISSTLPRTLPSERYCFRHLKTENSLSNDGFLRKSYNCLIGYDLVMKLGRVINWYVINMIVSSDLTFDKGMITLFWEMASWVEKPFNLLHSTNGRLKLIKNLCRLAESRIGSYATLIWTQNSLIMSGTSLCFEIHSQVQ